MRAQLISLVALLAMLAGCPKTPTDTAVDVAQAREEVAIKSMADVESEDLIKTADADLDVAKAKCDALNGDERTACVSTAAARASRDAAPEGAERFDH